MRYRLSVRVLPLLAVLPQRHWPCQLPDDRFHIDVHASGGRALPIETRKQRVDAEARRLAGRGATMVGILDEEGIDHYAVAMKDPEGNEFDIN